VLSIDFVGAASCGDGPARAGRKPLVNAKSLAFEGKTCPSRDGGNPGVMKRKRLLVSAFAEMTEL
jgi:hypothetical protein